MPIRKIDSTKYKGLYESYRVKDGSRTAYYGAVRDEHGKSVKRKLDTHPTESLIEANKAYQRLKIDMETKRKHTVKESVEYSLNAYMELFLEHKTASTTGTYRNLYNRYVKPLFGSKPLKKISRSDGANLRDSMQSKGYSSSTITTTLTMMTAIFNKAIESEILDTNPFNKVKKPSTKMNRRERVLDANELEWLFDNAPLYSDRINLFILLCYFTGQRPKSILELKVHDIIDGYVYIRQIKNQRPHKVKLNSKVIPYLKEWIDENNLEDDMCLFYASNKRHHIDYTTISSEARELFKPLNDKPHPTGEKVTMYTLRHTLATNIYKATGNIVAVKNILNHADLKMTMRYMDKGDQGISDDALDSL